MRVERPVKQMDEKASLYFRLSLKNRVLSEKKPDRTKRRVVCDSVEGNIQKKLLHGDDKNLRDRGSRGMVVLIFQNLL